MATFINPKLWKKNEAYQIGEIVISDGEIWQACLAVPAGNDLEAPYWAKIDGSGGGGGGTEIGELRNGAITISRAPYVGAETLRNLNALSLVSTISIGNSIDSLTPITQNEDATMETVAVNCYCKGFTTSNIQYVYILTLENGITVSAYEDITQTFDYTIEQVENGYFIIFKQPNLEANQCIAFQKEVIG